MFQGDVFKCLASSNHQSKTPKYSIYYNDNLHLKSLNKRKMTETINQLSELQICQLGTKLKPS